MRPGNKLIQDGIVPEPREVSNETFTSIKRSYYLYYLDGIEAGYKAGYEAGSNNGRDIGHMQAQDAYQMGLNDAWEAARWICDNPREKIEAAGLETYDDDMEMDEYEFSCRVVGDNDAEEAFEKVKAYKEKEAICKECSIIGMECPYDGLCDECQVNIMVEHARAKARESEEEI